jgi:hypothetical protein
MKRILSIVLISLLLFAGLSFALVKYPSTTIKVNTTDTTNETIKVVNITPISYINVTKFPTNETSTNKTNETKPSMVKPELISEVPIKPIKNETKLPDLISCIACGKLNISGALTNVTSTCDYTEAGDFLDYSHHYGDYADFDYPDYLEDIREDCDLLGLDENISSFLNQSLANLSLVETEMDEVENESQALVDRGLEAIECLREVNYTPSTPDPHSPYVTMTEIIPGRMYPSFPSRSHIGRSYHSGGIFNYVENQLENFHTANENAHTGYSYTQASMDNLENITLGLEDYCRRDVCVWPEDKDFYERLLEYEQNNAIYYADATKRYIEDAQDFAQRYHDLKENIDRVECMEFMMDTSNAPWMNMDLENVTNDTPKKVISPVKLAANFSNVTNVSLIGGEKPKYIIQSKKKRKLLWLFEVHMETKTELNAENGKIISEEKPWWSFLVGE